MNDPHVVSLSYSIKHDDSVDYEKAPPLAHETAEAEGAGAAYSTAERNWLEAAMKALIRRASQLAHAPKAAWPKITMADLPGL